MRNISPVVTLLITIAFLFGTLSPAFAAAKGAAPVVAQYSSSERAQRASNILRADVLTKNREQSREAGWHVLDSAFGLARTISDWLIPNAYAASKGAAPVAHWKFDEQGGPTAFDNSGSGKNGALSSGAGGTNTAVGQMWSRQGKIGGALECDGTDDYVSLGNITIDNTFTITGWFKASSLGGCIINARTDYIRIEIASSQLYFRVWDTAYKTVTSVSNLNTGQWYHFSAIYNHGSNIQLYLNGVYQGQTAIGNIGGSSTILSFGARAYVPDMYYSGLIDDVRVYNYARTVEQILMDYNAGGAGHLGAGVDSNEGNPPAAYWNFDENTGTTAYDRSGNGNDCALGAGTAGYRPVWAQGKNGSALYFDGTDDYLTAASTISIGTGDFTAEAWVKSLTPAADARAIVGTVSGGGQTGFLLYTCYGGSTVYFATWGASYQSVAANTQTNNDGKWHHIAGVRSGTTLSIYIDGNLDASATTTLMNIASGSVTPRIGAMRINPPSDTQHPFKGYIDDVKIYTYARSAGQIAWDYNRGKPVAYYRFDEGTGTIAHNDYSSADTGAAPVGWWRMDEGVGTTSTVDSSGNALNLSMTGLIAGDWAAGKIGPYCLNFASGKYLSVADNTLLDLSTAATIEAWVNPNAGFTTDYRAIVYKDGNGNAYDLSTNTGDGKIRAWFAGTSLNGVTALPASQWSHVVATYDGSQIKLYLNGALDNSTAKTGAMTNSSDALTVGVATGAASYPFVGKIDDVRVYNYARSPEQIYNDYKTTQGTLVGDTKFVDGKIGKALQFDGTGDYVLTNTFTGHQQSVGTLELWAYPAVVTGGGDNFYAAGAGGMATTGASRAIRVYNGGYWSLVGYGSGATEDWNNIVAATANTWAHVAYVWNGTAIKFYLNGVEYSATRSGLVTPTGTVLSVGGPPWSPATANWNGKIDDVRIYNYDRTAAQILQDYNAGGATRMGTQTAGVAFPFPVAGDTNTLPIAHWKLDDNTGVLARDASGNGNNGVLTNGPVWTQGKVGPALSFDGTDDYVTAPHNAGIDPSGALSVSAWVKPSSTVRQYIVAKGDGNDYANNYQIFIDTTAYFSIGEGTGATYASKANAIAAGNWYHLEGTFDGTTAKLYINGVLSGTDTFSGTRQSGGSLWIGKRNIASTCVNGLIDDVRLYNYARTPAQVAWDYNAGKPVGHWRFNEGSGTTAYDESDKNNDGTITIGGTGSQTTIGAAWANGAAGKFGKAMSFDGTDDYVDCGTSSDLDLRNSFTLSMWVYAATLHDGGLYDRTVIGSTNRQWLAHMRSGGTIAVRVVKGAATYDASPDVTYSAGSWFHLTAVYDGTALKSYKDGQLVGTVNVSAPLDGTASDRVLLGRLGLATGYWFNGKIDDVRLYNYPRTAEQIAQDYLNGASARLGD